MENIEIIEIETFEGVTEHVLIDRGNNEFTSMPKTVWDELQAQQAEHLNGIVDGETL